MKLVQEIATSEFLYIDDATYSANPSAYIDWSDRPAYWQEFGVQVADYWTAQDTIKTIYTTTGWANLKDPDKDVLIDFGVGDTSTEIIPYLIGKGYTQQEASGIYLNSVAKSIESKQPIARSRADNHRIITIVYSFLDSVEADGLLNAIANFLSLYKEKVYLGTEFGDVSDGLMDFINNTGSYASSSTTGLNKYSIMPDVITAYGDEVTAREAFRQQLNDWLLRQIYNGQYIKL
jgi:hypothetical protein